MGRLMESLVEGDLVNLLNERNIPVNDIISRRSGNYKGVNYEFDLIARNGLEVVFVEVKTTLRPKDVMEFKRKLQKVKTWLPEYTENVIYGAMAFLQADGSAERKAAKEGMLVIRATGDSAAIINKPDFAPKAF